MRETTTIEQQEMLPEGYRDFVKELKECVRSEQLQACLSVNRRLISLYWDIGNRILEKQSQAAWGDKILKLLSKDLRAAFPEMKGFSVRNLWYMRQFAESYAEIVQQPVAQIPWGHNCVLLQRLKSNDERLWYARKTIEHGWSRAVLTWQIDSGLYRREGGAITNFSAALPPPQSDLAQQSLKDPYCFDFLSLEKDFLERQLEKGLMDHLQKFMVELGAGFAFMGKQYPIEVAGKDYFLDMLFYHVKLRCYCVVELKATPFKPEDTGKLNFYLSAVDDLLRHPDDQPTIGLLLCKSKERVEVEYALRGMTKPIGVSGYEAQIVDSLPEELKGSLPSIEEIEAELAENEEQVDEEGGS